VSREDGVPRWALWDFEGQCWDEVPEENAPGEWLGGHNYGEGDEYKEATDAAMNYGQGFEDGRRAALDNLRRRIPSIALFGGKSEDVDTEALVVQTRWYRDAVLRNIAAVARGEPWPPA
jgi:hypothetical protein